MYPRGYCDSAYKVVLQLFLPADPSFDVGCSQRVQVREIAVDAPGTLDILTAQWGENR